MSRPPPKIDRPPGMEESAAAWIDDPEHEATLAALEEYRTTGESHDAREELDAFVMRVRERTATKQ
ncbi:MAG: hypothetical protein ACOY4K_16190 [Pseudomonadota bacterium]